MENKTDQTAPHRLAPIFGAVLAVTMVLTIGSYALHSVPVTRNSDDCYEQEAAQEDQAPQPIKQWPKPLVALVLSGQMHGFVDPCGCSEPQFGGLVRRYNFVQSLKAKKWDVVGVDLGELPSHKGIHKQNLLKYELSIRALGLMNYRAVGIGRDEMLLPLGEGLAQIWDKNKPYPRPLNLTLGQTGPGEKYDGLNLRPYEIIGNTTPKIGVINLMGQDLRDELKPLKEEFHSNSDELPKALKAFADAGVEVGIILHHEYPVVDPNLAPGIQKGMAVEKKRREVALKAAQYCAAERKLNPKIPPIQLMMILSEEAEPSAIMRPLDAELTTQYLEIGHKGRYIGVLGIFRAGKAYRLQYQMIHMSPAWKTKEGEEKANPVIALMETYNQDLKREDMLAKFPRTPHYNQNPPLNQKGLKATYVGTERCAACHNDADNVWSKTPHFKASETLENLKHPSGRQYDPECMMCHTTGFKHPGGYGDLVINLAGWPAKPAQPPAANKVKAHDDNLRGVGCESCHGPGSEHAKFSKNADLYPLINPYRLSKDERELEQKANNKTITPNESAQLAKLFTGRMRKMGPNLCMKCHDGENDVTWGQPGKDTADKWHKLVHRLPPKNNNGGANPRPQEKAPPALENDPPPTIEIIQDKK